MSQQDSFIRPLLRRRDQAALAVVAAVALGLLAWRWWWVGGLEEVDSLPRNPVRFQLDVNRADWPELAQLPEIGEALAKRIVRYRGEHGPFRSHDDLNQVEGIGEKTLDRIRPYLAPIPPVGTPKNRDD